VQKRATARNNGFPRWRRWLAAVRNAGGITVVQVNSNVRIKTIEAKRKEVIDSLCVHQEQVAAFCSTEFNHGVEPSFTG